jgi:hypothetical protein
MDISRSLNYAFDDPEWKTKLGLGALLNLVPVLNFAWQGYLVEIIRNVEAGQPLPLPTWDDLDKKWLDGLKLGGAMLIYSLPLFVLILAPIMLVVLPALVDNENLQGVLATIGGLGFLVTLCLVGVYGLALGFIYPAIQLHFAHTGSFAACFQIGPIVRLIREHSSNYVTAWVASLAVGLVLSFGFSAVTGVLGLIPCIGFVAILALLPVTLFGATWITTVHAYLFGQITQPAAGGAPALTSGLPASDKLV